MKKQIILVILLSFYSKSYFSQSNTNYHTKADENIYLNEQEYTVYTSDYKSSKNRLENFIRIKNYTIIKQEETKTSHYYEFNIKAEQILVIDSVTQTLGYVSNKQLTSYNNQEKLETAKIDLTFLKNKKKEYEKMLARMDSIKSDKYYQHWEKIRDIETEITSTAKKISQLEKISPLYRVKININDEQDNPTNTRISFINMPGVQYSCLFTESPQPGISYPLYQGVSLKYLFTKGKSYFSLGVLKSNEKTGSDTLINTVTNQIFNLSFGQDFYSKRFGRGSNRFMNLYVGYQVGASLLFTKNTTKTIPFANPGIGLELFKNKNILIDSGVHYYLPLSDAENRNLRGWLTNVSFNFVF